MEVGEEIVFIGVMVFYWCVVFEVVSFMIDILKIQVLFWKKEFDVQGECWVEIRVEDDRVVV